MTESKAPRMSAMDVMRMKPVMRAASAVNRWLFRATGGRLGNRMAGAPVGLLTTTGRVSGRTRIIPLIYLSDAGRVVLVASQGGLPVHPFWYRNLEADSEVEFQLGTETRPMRARTASAEEKRALWPRLCAVYAGYADYQARTQRDIPVVILEPR